MVAFLQELKLAELAVLKAATKIIEATSRLDEVQFAYKEDGSPVSGIDKMAESIIKPILEVHAPVISEEDSRHRQEFAANKSGSFWLADPLDGTSLFIRFPKETGGQIGYGPLVGWVTSGQVVVSCYYNLPTRTLFSAVRGQGVSQIVIEDVHTLPDFATRSKISLHTEIPLKRSVFLFYLSEDRGLKFVDKLKRERKIFNAYKFGGFASDCSRLLTGREQLLMHPNLKPWDFAATLLLVEAGFAVIIDPFGDQISERDYRLKLHTPVLVCHDGIRKELLSHINLGLEPSCA